MELWDVVLLNIDAINMESSGCSHCSLSESLVCLDCCFNTPQSLHARQSTHCS
jgi:hypothetical protein